MKQTCLIIFTLILAAFTLPAQIPERAEDISPLLIGENIPDHVLKAPDGSDQELYDILREKPTVLIIYRGGWCPFCNAHLADIQSAQSEIVKLGYQIVAVSPDSPENLMVTDEKHDLQYSLYSDSDGAFIHDLGIDFKAPERSVEKLLDYSGGLNKGILPVPSLFVVNKDGKIAFEYINPNYRVRISANLLLAVLKELKGV